MVRLILKLLGKGRRLARNWDDKIPSHRVLMPCHAEELAGREPFPDRSPTRRPLVQSQPDSSMVIEGNRTEFSAVRNRRSHNNTVTAMSSMGVPGAIARHAGILEVPLRKARIPGICDPPAR